MKNFRMVMTAILFACLWLTACADQEEGANPTPTPPPAITRIELLPATGSVPARLSLTVDGAGGPVFLRGQRGSLFYGAGETHIAKIDTSGCTVTRYWTSQDEYLDAAQRNGINLLHVELWNVWDAGSPFPFLRDPAGRFRVQAAIEGGQWNPEYFAAVRHLVEGASARGIGVIFSLFNHYNIRVSDDRYQGRPWAAEPFRAANTDTQFGLDEYGGDQRRRMAEFFRFANTDGSLTEVGRVQKALVERLLEEVTRPNVSFELLMTPWMVNNPNVDALGLARWESWIISAVRQKERALARSTGVLITVTPATLNSFNVRLQGQINSDFEIVPWKQAYQAGRAGYEGWGEVAILSYTGFFAFDEPPFPDEAAQMMRTRLDDHLERFPETVALYNTDGFNQRYAPQTCRGRLDGYVEDVRHGWWNGTSGGIDLSLYPLVWAERTHALTTTHPLGSIHFLNWTTAQDSMEDLSRGSW